MILLVIMLITTITILYNLTIVIHMGNIYCHSNMGNIDSLSGGEGRSISRLNNIYTHSLKGQYMEGNIYRHSRDGNIYTHSGEGNI